MSRLRRPSCAWAHAGARLRLVVRACAHTSLPATAWRGDRGRRVGAAGEGRRIPWLLLTFAGKIACSDRESSALRPNLSCEAPRTARTRQCSLGEAMCTCPFPVGRWRLRAQDRAIIKMEAGSRRSSSAAVQCALQVADRLTGRDDVFGRTRDDVFGRTRGPDGDRTETPQCCKHPGTQQ